ncbi:MAG TPA: tRNA uridine-5-carboxymethylaminomethyl(34) synthesis enzyme MnmG [Spirochaetia bacterium]|nr:tRNA uridine-5-carboxymethylaminomethyl(34) synthesis enzyme MnmG [Spirochaetia bacterium]
MGVRTDADFDAVVIGGGHAGIEACLALARIGFSTILVTQNLDAIGRMSCNPAIGGIAKGNLVREIDALGGQMARLIDATMIQFRILNASRGPAVQAPRAQADKQAYAALAKLTLEQQKNLTIFQDTVVDLVLDSRGAAVRGIVTDRGRRIIAPVVVLTTGTFMDGKLFIGEWSAPGGRLGEPAAMGLGASLRRLGFSVGRLKTGTPARALRGSLIPERMELQNPDPVARPFSFSTARIERPSVPCFITYTTPETHRIIRENIHRSPLYGGKIVGRGPRYCPSIEDKVMRFPSRERHQVFVEPEGLGTEEVYLNGVSSSLPEDVQERFLKSVPGLEKLVISRPGYAVEYDFLHPTQLFPSLMTKRIEGLFVAGQTNGTSGYEEAAAQGIVAGINAALFLQGKEPIVLSRAEAYIGVLVDDLVTLGTEEPYRLFTSRAEHRLSLMHETADIRLLPTGRAVGLQDETALDRLSRKKRGIAEVREMLRRRKVAAADAVRVPVLEAHKGRAFEQALRDPGLTIAELAALEPALAGSEAAWLSLAEVEVKYEGYIARQEDQVGRFQALEAKRIPPDFDWDGLVGVSAEAREKLKHIRPISVGQASRISGVRPPDVAILMVSLKRDGRQRPRS